MTRYPQLNIFRATGTGILWTTWSLHLRVGFFSFSRVHLADYGSLVFGFMLILSLCFLKLFAQYNHIISMAASALLRIRWQATTCDLPAFSIWRQFVSNPTIDFLVTASSSLASFSTTRAMKLSVLRVRVVTTSSM